VVLNEHSDERLEQYQQEPTIKASREQLFLFSAVIGIWKHGLNNWDSLMLVALLGILFSPSHVAEPFGRNLRWLLRIVFVLWVIACSSLLVHIWGWVPALVFAGLILVSPSKEKGVGWKAYFQKPQDVIS